MMRRYSRSSQMMTCMTFCATRACHPTTPPPLSTPQVVVVSSSHGHHSTALGRVLGGAGAAINTLLTQGEVGVGPTGHGSRHRVVNNLSCQTRPWEPSCVEIRNTKKHDEGQETLAHTSAGGRTRSVNIPKHVGSSNGGDTAATPHTVVGSSGQCHSMNDDDPVEVVFTFETSNDAGLLGFQELAEKVSRGELPGECRNTTGQGGFATWCVPRAQFMPLMAPLLAAHTQQGGGGGVQRQSLPAYSKVSLDDANGGDECN